MKSMNPLTGVSAKDASLQHGVPLTTLRDRLKVKGITLGDRRSRPRQKYTEKDLQSAIQDSMNGFSIAEAARKRGVPNTTLHVHLKARGILRKKLKWDSGKLLPLTESIALKGVDHTSVAPEKPPVEDEQLVVDIVSTRGGATSDEIFDAAIEDVNGGKFESHPRCALGLA